MRKAIPNIWENAQIYSHIYEEAVSHIWLFNRSLLYFLIYEEQFVFVFISVRGEKGGTRYRRINWRGDGADFEPASMAAKTAWSLFLEILHEWEDRVRTGEGMTYRSPAPVLSFSGAQESIPSLVGPYDNPVWRSGPPGYIGWRNRFLGSLNV